MSSAPGTLQNSVHLRDTAWQRVPEGTLPGSIFGKEQGTGKASGALGGRLAPSARAHPLKHKGRRGQGLKRAAASQCRQAGHMLTCSLCCLSPSRAPLATLQVAPPGGRGSGPCLPSSLCQPVGHPSHSPRGPASASCCRPGARGGRCMVLDPPPLGPRSARAGRRPRLEPPSLPWGAGTREQLVFPRTGRGRGRGPLRGLRSHLPHWQPEVGGERGT